MLLLIHYTLLCRKRQSHIFPQQPHAAAETRITSSPMQAIWPHGMTIWFFSPCRRPDRHEPAGTISAQLYLDGVPLPDTLRTVTAAVGQTVIPLETLLCLQPNCCCGHTVQVYVFGEATATITAWDMDAIRQA